MSEVYEPRLRPERLIAAGRVVLAGSSLFAVWFDPSEPVRFITLAYSVLVAYLLYALIVVATLVRADTISRRWSLVAHGMDLACCALLIFCTEGPSSPFNSLFVFALLAATLRWRARGALWTAGLVLTAFVASGLYFGVILADPDFDLRALIIRGVYLVVLTVLLHYVGTQDQRTVREMWSLAKWPHYLPRDIETLTRSLLQYAAGLMQAPRIDLHWTELDVAHTRHASWTNGRWTYGFEDQDEDDGGGEKGLTAPLRGESCHGHLSVYKRDTTIDDRVLAEIVADVIASRLDSFYLAERLRQTATTEERIRLARDLHDGILQSFTGIALRLAAIQRLLDSDPAAAQPQIRIERGGIDDAARIHPIRGSPTRRVWRSPMCSACWRPNNAACGSSFRNCGPPLTGTKRRSRLRDGCANSRASWNSSGICRWTCISTPATSRFPLPSRATSTTSSARD